MQGIDKVVVDRIQYAMFLGLPALFEVTETGLLNY